MFEDGHMTTSGVKVYTAVAHNVAGFNPACDDHQTQDILRKCRERGREILSENSEDSLTWSYFHAMSRLPGKDWLVDFFRAAVTDRFARAYAPYVDQAEIRFWVPHPSPRKYVEWLGEKVIREGTQSIQHIQRYEAHARAKERLAKILKGDPSELPERPTEVDVEIRLGKHLLVFIEVKLFSDLGAFGTFNPGRNQLLRNMELVEDVATKEGFADRRFILLTLDRNEKLYTRAMHRYRNGNMRELRQWDELGNWETLKADLPHRHDEPDRYFQDMTLKMGWIRWPDCWKIMAHHALREKHPCKP